MVVKDDHYCAFREEDNDDVVPIINAASTKLQEFYGEYYISEITRHPDGHRQLIISEDENGIATGVMCLNSNVDIDLLNENFELVPYSGLRKPHHLDNIPPNARKTVSEITDCFLSRTSKALDEHECIPRNRNIEALKTNGQQKDTNGVNWSPPYDQVSLYNRKSFVSAENNVGVKSNGENVQETYNNQKEERRVRIRSTDSPGTNESISESEKLDEEHIRKRTSTATSSGRNRMSVLTQESSNTTSDDLRKTLIEQAERKSITLSKRSLDDSKMTLLSNEIASSRLSNRESIFIDSLSPAPRKPSVAEDKVNDTTSSQLQGILSHPIYRGEINAFVVEIFVLKEEIDQRRSIDFIEAAFECFSDLDYCIMLLPSSQPTFPILQHFVHVPLRCNKDFPMTLYLAHRTANLDEITSRFATIDDRNTLYDFFGGFSNKEAFFFDFDEAINCQQKKKQCYIFQYNETVIGVCIVCIENDPDDLSRRYHVEDFISMKYVSSDEYGRLLYFILMPIFSIHERYFLGEIMRLCNLTVLYYRLYKNDTSALTRAHSLPNCLNSMMPVKPRRRVECRFQTCRCNLDEKRFSDKCCGGELFSLFMTTPRLIAVSYPTINTKIVLVGASDCGVALVEYLTLSSSYNFAQFTNITVVSPNGLPFEKKQKDIVIKMIPFRGSYCHEYRHLVAGRLWINVVYGTVVMINRKEKYVAVTNQGNLTYDYLVLTCGMQYRMPIFRERKKSQKTKNLTETDIPWNCIAINDDIEASNCLEKIRQLTEDLTLKKNIVLYGHNIDCYCTLNGLLEFGVNGSWITLIEPKLNLCETHDRVFFNDCEVDKALINEILASGIEILSAWNMIGWEVEEMTGKKFIKSITVESKAKTKTITCDILLNFDAKTIDVKTFLAISQAGLVFDDQLVIDPECRTNDPFIFAAGTMTKYSRKFNADSWQHRYYNPIEIGERVGAILRKVIDKHEGEDPPRTVLPKGRIYLTLPVFRTPTIVSCTLPGGYHYLHVRKPGKKILRKIAIAHDFYGDVMVTGSCTSKIGYFRIRLNNYDTVETITCYSKEDLNVQHIISLYGKHEKLLNDLKIRFEKSSISDFFAYFREPWAAAIFNDKFECLRVENRATLLSKQGAVDGESLVDDCMRALFRSNWERISKEDRRYIESRYAGSVYHQQLKSSLIQFLQYYETDLPMFCNPRLLRQIYTDLQEDSPLFFRT